MNKLTTALALAIAFPVIAHAHTASAPAAKFDCCENVKTGADAYASHDMSQTVQTTSLLNHQ